MYLCGMRGNHERRKASFISRSGSCMGFPHRVSFGNTDGASVDIDNHKMGLGNYMLPKPMPTGNRGQGLRFLGTNKLPFHHHPICNR